VVLALALLIAPVLLLHRHYDVAIDARAITWNAIAVSPHRHRRPRKRSRRCARRTAAVSF
jgi:hypothetical protein